MDFGGGGIWTSCLMNLFLVIPESGPANHSRMWMVTKISTCLILRIKGNYV